MRHWKKYTALAAMLAGTWLPAAVVCEVPDRVARFVDRHVWVDDGGWYYDDCCYDDHGFSFDFLFDWF